MLEKRRRSCRTVTPDRSTASAPTGAAGSSQIPRRSRPHFRERGTPASCQIVTARGFISGLRGVIMLEFVVTSPIMTVDDFVAAQSLRLQQGSTGLNKPTASA